MKKSVFRAFCLAWRRGETPKGGWGRVYGVGQTTDGKLARKAAEGKLARPVGVVSKALAQIERNRRAA
mgnify:FL=1